MDIFYDDADRHFYLERLHLMCACLGIQVLSYTLMTNHVHHVMVPPREDSFELLFRPLHSGFATYINAKMGWCGHLFQNRFYSGTIQRAALHRVIRYVELNPARANLGPPELYRWSSALSRLNGPPDPILTTSAEWLTFLREMAPNWSDFLKGPLEAKEMDLIRRRTRRGIPYGSDDYLEKLGKLLGRDFFLKRGPKPRHKQDMAQLITYLESNYGI